MVADQDGRSHRPSADVVLLVVLLIGGALLGMLLMRGWFPHDEGALGQSAERVLRGEIPHRDFDEIYTGLLSYLHAGVFALFGVGSVFLRIPLFIAALGWLIAMYRILLRFAPPVGAGAAALVAFVWGVPNYPASMPSWYILFAATFCALALLRWQETSRTGFLVVAGALGGIAFLFKLSGIFVLLGGGLALLAAERAAILEGEARTNAEIASRSRRGPFEWALGAVLLLAVLALGAIAVRGSERELLRIAFPTSLLALAIIGRTWAPPFASSRERWVKLIARVAPFAVGAAVPIAAFLLFHAWVGGVPELLEGVFVTPFRRVAFASVAPPSPGTLLAVVPLAAFLWLRSTDGAWRHLIPITALLWFGTLIALSGSDPRFYRVAWFSAWGLLFIVAIEGARFILAPRDSAVAGTPQRAAAITVCCLAVALALLEYPFAAPIYTLYALPLTFVAVVAAVRTSGRASPRTQLVVLAFFCVFGLVRILPGSVGSMGRGYLASADVALLELPRGGLRMDPREAVQYEDLIRFVVAQADGRPIWAGPDSPEVYFLAGIPNRTRTFFDFLDSPDVSARPLVERINALGAAVVVVKLNSQFSRPPSPDTYEALRESFPHARGFPGFLVFWK